MDVMRSLEVDAWCHGVSRCYCLTLGEVMEMKKDQKMKLLFIQPETIEKCCSNTKSNKATKPELFFKTECFTYRHNSDTNGVVELPDGQEEKVEFHVFVEPNVWHPLAKGKLKKLKSPIDEDLIGKSFKDINPLTPIGVRGAAIPWKTLSQLPMVHHTKELS